ncbi:MAG TPA: alpha/beta hydrolase [Acidimicrobiia bacterium]
MVGLVKPPKEEKPTRLIARFVGLILLVAIAGTIIWNYTTQSNIDLIEIGSVASLGVDPEDLIEVDGMRIRVVQHSEGSTPLVLLHDVDVGGSIAMADLAAAASDFQTVTIDLPGFGLSTRIPEPGEQHTVGNMAEVVGGVLDRLFTRPVVVAGVGLGGKVAADLAVRRPELVAGLVMIDTDFWAEDEWRQRAQKLPLIGESMTYTYETSGRFAESVWAPHCDEGGWCPTPQQLVDRTAAARLRDSTASIHAFWNTPQASLVPSDLGEVRAPTAYVWSLDGPVPRETVERIKAEIPAMTIMDVDVFAAHLESPSTVVEAVRSVGG